MVFFYLMIFKGEEERKRWKEVFLDVTFDILARVLMPYVQNYLIINTYPFGRIPPILRSASNILKLEILAKKTDCIFFRKDINLSARTFMLISEVSFQ